MFPVCHQDQVMSTPQDQINLVCTETIDFDEETQSGAVSPKSEEGHCESPRPPPRIEFKKADCEKTTQLCTKINDLKAQIKKKDNDVMKHKLELEQAQLQLREICNHPIGKLKQRGAHTNMHCYFCDYVMDICNCSDCEFFKFASGQPVAKKPRHDAWFAYTAK